jgi:O-antigen/teichoic acid export membrane protein
MRRLPPPGTGAPPAPAGGARPSVLFAAIDMVSKVLAFAVVIVLGRRLSPDNFGEVVSALAVAGIAAALFDVGVNFRLVALVVSDTARARQMVNRRYRVLLAVVALALAAATVPSARLIALSLAAAVFMASLPTGALLASGDRNWAAASLVVPNLLFLAPMAFARELAPDTVMGYWALVNLLTLLTLWRGVPWLRPIRAIGVSTADMVRDSFSIAFFNVVVLAYGRADTILVAVMVSASAAGIYGTYYRLVLAAVSLASWSGGVLARRLFDAESGEDQLRRLLRALVAIGVVAAPVLYLLLPEVIGAFLGSPADLSRPTRLALALVPIPTMSINALVYFLVVRERQRRLTWVSLRVLVAAAALYPLLIGLFGVAGAAAASLVIESIALALFYREATRR